MQKRHDIMCGMVEWHCDDECRRMDCQTQQLFESWVLASDGFCFFQSAFVTESRHRLYYALLLCCPQHLILSRHACFCRRNGTSIRKVERSKGRSTRNEQKKELPNCITKRQNFWPWVTVGNLSGKKTITMWLSPSLAVTRLSHVMSSHIP